VEEYIRKFEYLMLRCDIKELEKQTIARFLGELKREFAEAIRLQPFWSLMMLENLLSLLNNNERSTHPKQPLK